MSYRLIIFKSIKKGAFHLIKGNILNSIGIAYLRSTFIKKMGIYSKNKQINT